MNIGVVGLGKLGLPMALAIQERGHDVVGCDRDPARVKAIYERTYPDEEILAPELLKYSGLTVAADISRVVWLTDIIFLAVQTPHQPQFEGTTRLTAPAEDFDYTWLIHSIREITHHARSLGKSITLAIMSTVLPGTYRRDIRPLMNGDVQVVYNPSFIAMGQVIPDFYNPEFVLLGHDNDMNAIWKMERFYDTIHSRKTFVTDITTAEAIKVSYNTFITAKTVLANLWGEIAHKIGANFDDIYRAWSLATDRLISDKYLQAGMGDGGGCHPRDNIALSWLAYELNLSHDLFDDLIYTREYHTAFLADVIQEHPGTLCLLGRSFKPETKIETGSPAILLSNILREYKREHAHVEDFPVEPYEVYFVSTQHAAYTKVKFPQGSTVIDPFGYLDRQDDVNLVKIGRK